MNNGLNDNLKNEFNIIAVQGPLVEFVKWELNKYWLAGFIEAEGCFSVYKLHKDKDYLIASFDVSQINGEVLLSAIPEYLSFTTAIHIDKTNCSKLKVTSVRSKENIIRFLQSAPVKLLGNKRLQYLL